MALKNLKLKLKSNLKQSVEEETAGNSKKDPRILNYYDMKVNEKMRLLIVPDVNGELWTRFRKHGPNMKIKGIGSIRCLHEATGEPCDACQKGFDFLNLEKETGDKSYKDDAKRWFAKDYTYMSVLVLDSPIEVQESPDKNEVKLFPAPYAVEKMIREALKEGQLDEDDLCTTPFVLKKTENSGGFADYSTSYFERKNVTDEELEFFEDRVVEQFDYSELDVVPAIPTEEEMAEWVAKAEEKDEKAKSGGSDKPRNTRTTRSAPTDQDDDDDGDSGDQSDDGDQPEPEKESPPATDKKPGGSLRDRLKKSR